MRATRVPRPSKLAAVLLLAAPQDPGAATQGHELVYRFDVEHAIARGELDPKVDPDAVVRTSLDMVRKRLQANALEAEVSLRGTDDVVVRVPGDARAMLPAIRRAIETPAARLEMRMVVDAARASSPARSPSRKRATWRWA